MDKFDKFLQHKYLKPKFLIKGSLYLVIGILFLLVAIYMLFLKPPRNFPSDVIKNIPAGESLRSLSQKLKEEGYINSRLAFESFVIMYGGERHILPGDYLFKSKLPVFELARRISFGIRGLTPIKSTIPEGWNNVEIGDYLEKKLPNFSKENFLKISLSKEGYLFPDTYFFFPTVLEDEVMKTMENNYEVKMKDVRPKIEASGKTEKDIIIMASIIEREAKGDADREFISGILWNRITIGMPLQVDAWPETYKEKGLPEHPISNPGLEAINAAIYPKKSLYIYYLHGKDGQIHYAQNFAEHKANKLRYLK